MKNFFYGKVYRRAGRLNFTLIELLVVKTCQIYHSSLVCTGLSREGFGGEKAAGKAASLPVPNNHQTIIHQPITAPQQSFRSASGEVEQKREEIFPQKSGKSRSRCCVLRLFLLVPADRSRVRLRPVCGTGTLPDAGGAGGGGHAPCLPRPGNEKSGIYAYRAPRGDCDHRDSGVDAAARAAEGAGSGKHGEMPGQSAHDGAGNSDVRHRQ